MNKLRQGNTINIVKEGSSVAHAVDHIIRVVSVNGAEILF